MIVLGIDPGPQRHAWALVEGPAERPKLIEFGHDFHDTPPCSSYDRVVIEMVACYGMAAGASLFDTCVEIGSLLEYFRHHSSADIRRVSRIEVKRLICHRTSAKDANVRAALMDIWGGKAATKKGAPLHGVSKDAWAALAVAVAALDPGVRWYVPAHERAERAERAER
jgi:hypothetical protein